MSTMDLVAQLVELWTNELEIMSSKPSLTLLEKLCLVDRRDASMTGGYNLNKKLYFLEWRKPFRVLC